jgi:hypothetical protein
MYKKYFVIVTIALSLSSISTYSMQGRWTNPHVQKLQMYAKPSAGYGAGFACLASMVSVLPSVINREMPNLTIPVLATLGGGFFGSLSGSLASLTSKDTMKAAMRAGATAAITGVTIGLGIAALLGLKDFNLYNK